MLFLLAPAASQIGVHQLVVGCVHFVSAVAPAVPDHPALICPLLQRIQRGQPVESLSADICEGVILDRRAAAAGLSSRVQQRSGNQNLITAVAPAPPPSSAALILRLC